MTVELCQKKVQKKKMEAVRKKQKQGKSKIEELNKRQSEEKKNRNE